MTNQLSPGPWVDGPYELIPLPKQTPSGRPHIVLHATREMVHVHNVILRSLNAIVLQGPQIPDSPDHPSYSQQDLADFLYYVVAWVKTVEHHHHSEETVLFPDIEKLAGESGLMSHAEGQHAAFHDGLHKLQEYAESCLNAINPKSAETKSGNAQNETTGKYKWVEMKTIIDSFATAMMEHLHDEIKMLLPLERLDEKGFEEVWKKTEKAAKESGGLQLMRDIFPLILGARDVTAEGGEKFPPVPTLLTLAIKYWLSRTHAGSWRFNPCDLDGRPRPLAFPPSVPAS